MHGFVSYRRSKRARSLRSDRAVFALGPYVATELGLSLVATYRPNRVRAGCYAATLFVNVFSSQDSS
ncbi:hypothetical protein F2Q69_00006137 [Brassica cretica]|uniref:Uncharacterized protein n=1 Tax=Brassica cretica TaxID=69181 RepID=A0A8S9P8C0_BRACR|nr:hypothetical protein F2Q69_00006137 [Brassica cretica]